MLKLYCKKCIFAGLVIALNITLSSWRPAGAQEIVPDPPAHDQIKLKTGWIDAISKTDIVIDDLSSPLSGVTVVDQRGFTVGVSSLSVGRSVAFKRDGEKTEIHLLAEQEKRPELPGDNNAQQKYEIKKEGIRQVDGVWRN